MTPYFYHGRTTVYQGDMRDVLLTLPENSVESIVTDPPYGLTSGGNSSRGFMGKEWDHGVPGVPFWEAALRVARPGAHMLAFGGTRTFHRLATAIEDAGWELRDTIGWLYSQGFPKSLDVSKAIDKAAGAKREQVQPGNAPAYQRSIGNHRPWMDNPEHTIDSNVPVTPAAQQWAGWGSGIKPSWEPILLCRKPLRGTLVRNVLNHGTGALNIDACRVGTETLPAQLAGRWPANLIHDGSDEVLSLFPQTGKSTQRVGARTGKAAGTLEEFAGQEGVVMGHTDSGSAARFFYAAKASHAERGAENKHPTVKPQSLMRYLVRLVTPPGGTVLDCFAGSGSTMLAAEAEGFAGIAIELEQESCDTIDYRLRHPLPRRRRK